LLEDVSRPAHEYNNSARSNEHAKTNLLLKRYSAGQRLALRWANAASGGIGSTGDDRRLVDAVAKLVR